MSHIIYLTSARLPTQKAHGLQVMKMCEAMAALGHEVELLHPWRHQADRSLATTDAFSYYGVDRTFRLCTLSNWDVVRLERRVPDRPFRAIFAAHELGWGLAAACRAARAKPDLIYTRSVPLAYWAARLGRACAFEAHLPPSTKTRRLVRGLSRRASTRAVFALTGHTAMDLEASGVPREKIQVLPDAADLSAFAGAPPMEDARTQLGLPLRRPIIGYIGRFETLGREKGVGELIRAAATPELRRLDCLLLCVGGPMDRVRRYMDLGESLGIPEAGLRFVDRVPNTEVSTWLAAVDVGAIPAPADGSSQSLSSGADRYSTATSPMKLFEYMAAGLPIVAADLPGTREVLDDGRNGVLIPAKDPEALARALARLIEDVDAARMLGDRARQDAAQYTWLRRAERALTFALSRKPSVETA